MTQFLMLVTVIFAVMACVVVAMAVGVMVTGREIKGSCGGIGGDCACSRGERARCTTASTAKES